VSSPGRWKRTASGAWTAAVAVGDEQPARAERRRGRRDLRVARRSIDDVARAA
jgi:hypothetical protein